MVHLNIFGDLVVVSLCGLLPLQFSKTSSVRNVDPWMPIQYDKPNCTLLCPEPFPIPAGELG